MNIREVHYGFKSGLNKVDSLQQTNFTIPQIDFYLNRAVTRYVEMQFQTFDTDQSSIDRLSVLLQPDQVLIPLGSSGEYTVDLTQLNPTYGHLVKIDIEARKGDCVASRNWYVKHTEVDDLTYALNSSFYSPSFEWRVALYQKETEDKLRLFTNNEFIIEKVWVSYLKKADKMGNPNDYPGGTYNLLDDTVAIQGDCIFSDAACLQIIDLAVLEAVSDITTNIQTKFQINNGN